MGWEMGIRAGLYRGAGGVGSGSGAKLGAANNLDFFDKRAVQEKTLFDTEAACYLANGDAARMLTLVVGTDDDAFKHLDTLFAAFFDFLVHTHGITAAGIDDLLFLLLVVDFLD